LTQPALRQAAALPPAIALAAEGSAWKPAINAFAVTFGDRFPAAETY
jgi:putative transposase